MAQRGATDAGTEARWEGGRDEADDLPRIPFAAAEITPDAREAAVRVLASGWVTTGPEVAAFEREFADWVGAPHAVAVSSCTAAIELALRGLRLPPGSKVLTSVLTFCGAVHAITHAGHEPVFADVDPETLMPGPAETAAAAARAGGVDAMLVLHFAGAPAPVAELAAAAGLPLDRLVEDAAHAVGGWVGERQIGGSGGLKERNEAQATGASRRLNRGRPARGAVGGSPPEDRGTISAATCFSFYATKNLPIGEGGMLTTADGGLADWARMARLHGMSRDAWKRYLPGASWRYRVELDGLKANLTDVQAAIGRAHLRHLPAWQERRGELADRYDKRLAEVPGVAVPWRPRPEQGRHAWHLYVIRVGPGHGLGRDALIAELARRGIDCSVHFIPLHHQPWFQERWGAATTGGFPVADAVFPEILSLPLYPRLADGDVDRVCEAIADLGGRSAGGQGMAQ